MAMLVGFHLEGWDHLIVRAFLAKLLGLAEDAIGIDWIDQPGRGWQFIKELAPKALHRFYGQCAQFAIVGMDNDGNVDLDATAQTEDPAHPRHWNHPGKTSDTCKWCQLDQIVQQTRQHLTWLPQKPGWQWPVVVIVPVEMIESWLLTARGELRAEYRSRQSQKQRFYGKPEPTKQDVESKTLPMIRALESADLGKLKENSRSFRQFAEQVDKQREHILGSRDCWQAGDKAAER